MFSRPRSGEAAAEGQSGSRKKLIIPAAAVLAALIYYLLFDFKRNNAGALSGELSMNGSAPQQIPQGSGFTAFLCDYFGAFVYVLPLLLIFAALALTRVPRSIRQWDFFKAGLRLLGLNTLVLGGTSLLSAVHRGSAVGAGGILGDFLNGMLHSLIGVPLTAAVSLLLTLTGVLLLTGRGPLQLFDSLGALVFSVLGRSRKDKDQAKGAPSADGVSEDGDGAAVDEDSVLESSIAGGEVDLPDDIQVREYTAPEGQPAEAGEEAGEPPGPAAGRERPSAAVFNSGSSAAAGAAAAAATAAEQEAENRGGPGGCTEPGFGAAAGLEPDFSAAAAGLPPASSAGQFHPGPGSRHDRVEPDFGAAFAAAALPQQQPAALNPAGTAPYNPQAIPSQPAIPPARPAAAAIPGAQSGSAWRDNPYYAYPQGVPGSTASVAGREESHSVSTIITRSNAQVTPAASAPAAAPAADQGPSTIITVGGRSSAAAQAAPDLLEDPALTDPNVVHTVITYNQPEAQPAAPEDDHEVHTNIFTTPITPVAPAAMPDFSDHGIPPADGYPEDDDNAGAAGGSSAGAGNIINFADFAAPLYYGGDQSQESPAAAAPAPAARRPRGAYDGLRDDREHIKEKDLAARYPTASRGVLGSAQPAVPPAPAAAPEIPAAPEAPAALQDNGSAFKEPVAASAPAEEGRFEAPAVPDAWFMSRAPQPSPAPAADPLADIPAAAPAGSVPQSLQSEQLQSPQNPEGEGDLSVPEPEPEPAPAPDEGAALPSPAAQGQESALSFGYSTGQNSNTSNLPSYLQDTENGLNVEERGAPLISKPLDFSFVPSSVSAPKTFYDAWRPDYDLLTPSPHSSAVDTTLLDEQAQRIDRVLKDFNIRAHVVSYESGPVITRYALQLDPGVRFASINNLVQDLERNLKVQTNSVRAISSLPGTIYAGLEVPSPQRRLISLHEVVITQTFEESRAELPLCLGEDVVGRPVVVDLATAPHLLIAGTTGSGKSACLNAMLMSLLLKRSPAELRLILIDPKRLEFSPYNGLPHLLTEVISDVAEKTGAALQWCIEEMERRYKLIESFNVRKLSEYNEIIEQAQLNDEQVIDPAWTPEMGGQPPALKKLPYIVIVIEEFADLMAQTSGRGKKGEDSPEQSLSRLAAKSRACGIHIILATQTPRSEIITGTIRANMPSRVALTVQSHIESQLVLGESGAECLLGNGDMLSKFNGYNRNASFRAHGAFVFNEDVARVVAAWKEHGSPEYIENITERPADAVEADDGGDGGAGGSGGSRRDALFDKAAEYARDYYQSRQKPVPISELQVVFGIGYARAKRLVVLLQREGLLTGE